MRLLAHPRFRAAFDFLVLRQFASEEHGEEVAFWREAQTQPIDDVLATESQAGDADGTMATDGDQPRKRRRRRRRPVASE